MTNKSLFSKCSIGNAYDTCIVVPADMLATPQKSYGHQHSFQILSTFSYDIFVGCWPADTVWQWAKYN